MPVSVTEKWAPSSSTHQRISMLPSAGVYFAALVQFIEPAPFHVASSLTMLLAIIVGGSGRFFGPVVGTIIIILLPEALRASNVEWLKFMQKWYLVFFGVAVVLLMVWLPGGILSIADRWKKAPAAPAKAEARP